MPMIKLEAAKSVVSVREPLTAEDAAELEQLWAEVFSKDSAYVARASFGTKTELASYKRKANAYLSNRPDGALVLRQTRSGDLPDNEMRFVIESADSRAARIAANKAAAEAREANKKAGVVVKRGRKAKAA